MSWTEATSILNAYLGNNLLDSSRPKADDGADGDDPWFSVHVRRSGSPEDEDAVLHAMIFSYFDESADEKREAYMVCGGILAHHQLWNGFEIRWRDETKELEKPFRAAECESQKGQFESWPKNKCDELMARLTTVIQDFRFGGFASIVPIPDFKKTFAGLDADAAYELALAHTILNMAYIAEKHGQVVKLWFEDSTKGQKAATIRIYDDMRELKCWNNRHMLHGISFDTKTLRPLQAADLVAREAFKHPNNLGKRPARIPIKRLWPRISFLMWTWEELEQLRERGWPNDLGALACWQDKLNPYYFTERLEEPNNEN
jgi:hypothetical protein